MLFDEKKIEYLRRDDEAFIPMPPWVNSIVATALYGTKPEVREASKLLMDLGRNGTHGNAGSIVANPAVFDHADINFNNVPVLNDPPRPANAMHDFLVQGNADLAWITFVVEKGTPAAGIGHELRGSGIDLARADAWTDQRNGLLEHPGGRVTGLPQSVDLRAFAQGNPGLSITPLHGTGYPTDLR